MAPVTKTWRWDDNGYLVHDGDCHFWDCRICTCGLLHHLRPMTFRALKLLPDFYKQDGAQSTIMMALLSSDLVKAANAVMERPERDLTPKEQKEFDECLRRAGIEP